MLLIWQGMEMRGLRHKSASPMADDAAAPLPASGSLREQTEAARD